MSAPWYGHFGSCDVFPLVPLSVLESVLEQIVLKYDKKVNNDCSHCGILAWAYLVGQIWVGKNVTGVSTEDQHAVFENDGWVMVTRSWTCSCGKGSTYKEIGLGNLLLYWTPWTTNPRISLLHQSGSSRWASLETRKIDLMLQKFRCFTHVFRYHRQTHRLHLCKKQLCVCCDELQPFKDKKHAHNGFSESLDRKMTYKLVNLQIFLPLVDVFSEVEISWCSSFFRCEELVTLQRRWVSHSSHCFWTRLEPFTLVAINQKVSLFFFDYFD